MICLIINGCFIYLKTTGHVLEDYTINHYDCKTHTLWQFTTPFLFLGKEVEWNGLVKCISIFGINENIWVII